MQLFVGLVQFHASFLLGVCYEAYCSLLYLRATRAIAQYCVGVFYFWANDFFESHQNCLLESFKVQWETERSGHLSFSTTTECVTSGGLLSTNILLLWHNMATGHAPLSEVAKKNSKKSHPDDEQQQCGG